MTDLANNTTESVGGFQIHGRMMRYNLFVPRLYNWCKSLGFEAGKIMPSRAFCSDESQGYPIIMIAKHFGTFPFNHGRVGGVIASDRNGPHAAHGQNLVIIQASHVGYDPVTQEFGRYRRLQTEHQECSPSCGKITQLIAWYQNEYRFAQDNILLHKHKGKPCITIDNLLLREDRKEGLLLRLEHLIEADSHGQRVPLKTLSTAQMFTACPTLVNALGEQAFNAESPQQISKCLSADKFYFRRELDYKEENGPNMEKGLIRYMPRIVTSHSPILTAAQTNTQIEFDSTFRMIVRKSSYYGKKILFISGLNIDISPQPGQIFPLTKFVPWAAFIQDENGVSNTIEQDELFAILNQQQTDNPDQINLEDAIQSMTEAKEVKITL